MKTLKDVKVGETATVARLHGEGPVKRRIMDMGITKGVQIYVRKVAPLGDPMELTVRNYELSVRKADAEMIEIVSPSRQVKYANKGGKVSAMSIKIALAGNPNCGKTTLFNDLTGSNQYVGNWPGVTVEKKEGKLKGDKDVIIQDLPGIYSLSPYTLEEVVARSLPGKGEARRHPEHHRRHQHRAQPLPDHPADRAGHPGGHGCEHDRSGAQERR